MSIPFGCSPSDCCLCTGYNRIFNDDILLTALAVSALQVIEQSTGLDLGWQEDPCSPFQWNHIGCEGSIVTSLYVNSNNPIR